MGREAWLNEDGDVVHPDAPRGGGGPGRFRSAGPLGSEVDWTSPLPHPHSPAARYLALDDTHRRVRQHHFSRVAKPPAADAAINAKLKNDADALVAKPAVGSGECYDLADLLLTNAGAKSAPDFCTVTRTADYKWGTKIDVSDIKEGDVLQFRNHKIIIITVKKTKRTQADGSWREETERMTETHQRPHHTAIVSSVDGDGLLSVVEQHVKDPETGELSHVVRKSELHTRSVGPRTTKVFSKQGDVKIEQETTVTIKVSGTISAYRPQPR